jgi:hypothetical protein
LRRHAPLLGDGTRRKTCGKQGGNQIHGAHWLDS